MHFLYPHHPAMKAARQSGRDPADMADVLVQGSFAFRGPPRDIPDHGDPPPAGGGAVFGTAGVSSRAGVASQTVVPPGPADGPEADPLSAGSPPRALVLIWSPPTQFGWRAAMRGTLPELTAVPTVSLEARFAVGAHAGVERQLASEAAIHGDLACAKRRGDPNTRDAPLHARPLARRRVARGVRAPT